MTPGRVACGMALLAAFCVLGIFFFPVMDGPYSAVHGPVTALLSIRAAARLRWTIVRTALTALRGWFGMAGTLLTALSCISFQMGTSDRDSLPAEFGTVLRC